MMADERMELFQNVVDAILSTPGETPATLRADLTQQPAYFYGLPAQQEVSLPLEIKMYVTKVATHAYKVTDRDTDQLRADGYDEDAIFEITLSVAAGAGIMCLNQGLAALKGANDAAKKD